MGASSNAELLVAFHRFGRGIRPGVNDLRAIGNDPRGFVAAELAKTSPLAPTDSGLQASPELIVVLEAQREREKQARATPPSMAAPPAADSTGNRAKPPPAPLTPLQQRVHAEAQARLQLAHKSGCGFVERLVTFWSNHFCVAAIVRTSRSGSDDRSSRRVEGRSGGASGPVASGLVKNRLSRI